jgi:serine/threonine protein kinase
MRYLHENRLVHGDLKPQNVMLQPSPAGGVPEVCPTLCLTSNGVVMVTIPAATGLSCVIKCVTGKGRNSAW